jgi:hypothetical protein
MKSGNLNFLEPSGPLQACNGTALPLPCGVLREFTAFILNEHSNSLPRYTSMHSVTTVPEEFAASVFLVVIIPSMPTLMHCKDL